MSTSLALNKKTASRMSFFICYNRRIRKAGEKNAQWAFVPARVELAPVAQKNKTVSKILFYFIDLIIVLMI